MATVTARKREVSAAIAGETATRADSEPRELTPVSWSPRGRIPQRSWIECGRRFSYMGRSSQWWIGDWVRFGEAAYGAKYREASKITRYDIQTLMNMVYVASRFEVSRRRETLAWSHHAELAALEPESQDRWLDRCEAERFSVHDLRIELRQAERTKQVEDAASAAVHSAEAPVVSCPECGFRFETNCTQ